MSIIALRCKRHNRDQKLPFRLLQIERDSSEMRAMREITDEQSEAVAGAWSYTARPLETGMYCWYCLNEGDRKPLPIDSEDIVDLGFGDEPVVFIAPKEFDPAKLASELQARHPRSVRYVQTLSPIPAVYAADTVLDQLHPVLTKAIRDDILAGSGQLYQFQEDAIAAVMSGKDIIVTTPTASGKSLTYVAPIMSTLLNESGATALYISPLVALTGDQLDTVTRLDRSRTDWTAKGERFAIYRSCRTLEFDRNMVVVARYDGSVARGDRRDIRKQKPQWIFTTPDMLHMALLNGAFDENQWAYLFRGLRYIVIDELHTYRGVMGAAFSNLMRRLLRICKVHGASPQFLCASATIANPVDTVHSLIGRKPIVIDGGGQGAPQRRREFIVWSETGEDEEMRALSTQGKDVLVEMMKSRVRTIAFGRSISEINDIYRFSQAELREAGYKQIKLSPFMRELKPEDKRQIVRQLRSGQLHAVISTTALALGIDIGALSASTIIGFPGSIAQLWQEAGRAGRLGDGLVILILDKDPLDQFFVAHPEVLFDIGAEPVYCNPDNPYVVRTHLLCAARELALSPEEISVFGPSADAIVKRLRSEGLLEASQDGRGLSLAAHAADSVGSLPFRNLGFAIDVLTEDERTPIVQVDSERAQKALHKYAHYQHIDRYYEVTLFDVNFEAQRGQILVRELEKPEYVTTAKIDRAVEFVEVRSHRILRKCDVAFGMIRSKTDVTGYYKVPLFARAGAFVFQPLGMAAPPALEYETQAYWITFDVDDLPMIPEGEFAAGMYSLAGAIRLATAIEELCDPSDVEAVGEQIHPETGVPTIIVFDAIPGGMGICEAALAKLESVLSRAKMILEECPYCSKHPESRGCPYCVTARYGDETTINRSVALQIAEVIFS